METQVLGEAVPYPAFVNPYVFEELRASIVSSILMGSLIGFEASPTMLPENQWLTGMGILRILTYYRFLIC